MRNKVKEKLGRILQDLRDSGFEKELPSTELRNAIMRQVGVNEATIKVYKQAMCAYGLMQPNKQGTVWVIK